MKNFYLYSLYSSKNISIIWIKAIIQWKWSQFIKNKIVKIFFTNKFLEHKIKNNE